MITQAKVLIGLAAIVAAGLAVHGYNRSQQKVGEVRVLTAQQPVVAAKVAQVQVGNALKDDKAERADHDTQTKTAAVAVAAGVSLDAHLRLLDTLDRVRADALRESATRAGLAAQVAAATNSLGECSGRYTAVAKERDELSVQVSGLLALVPPITPAD